RYLMINAAVPIESYAPERVDADQEVAMTEQRWRRYDRRLASHSWWELFTESDARRSLKWRGQFASSAVVAVNFYSSQEDVVANVSRVSSASILATILRQGFNVSYGAWKAQELV